MRAWRRWLLIGWALGTASVGCSASEASELDDPRTSESTREPGEVPVRVRFRARVGEVEFACGQSYAAGGTTSAWLTPADLRFFVRDVRFATADGSEQPLSLDRRAPWQLEDVALLDFEDGTGACAAGTSGLNLELTGSLPPGEYVALSFENGVPEARNHADPATQPPPLQAGSMHWGWLLGYRFLMAEVSGESEPGGSATGSALFHLGSTGCSGAPAAGGIVCDRQNRNRVRLDGFDLDSDEVVVDVLRLFDGLDLTGITTCHSSGGAECVPFFERVGVDAADGSALGDQALFRVEPARGQP